ncbi:MAG: UDP-4-amino-4,6-dideoxy-N-acetyl-beta-L-altrosamine transaminase [Bacteroidota bacterium]|nr:UDP-4-amino-4,6-dideoxy-N-acetyl-beta-L-altrosamine transaminase [Bacteroidota bacterium]
MRSSVIPYGRQEITEKDIEAVVETLKSDFLTQGPKIIEFEKKFAEYCGAKYAVAVSNGTAALHLSAMALGVKQGDKVITTPNTFAASANCVLYCGGEVVFCDINPDNFLLDLDKLEEMLSESTLGTYKGIIPVDFAGYPIDAERLRLIADKYGLWILEDACHAPGAFFADSKGNKQICGSNQYTDLTVFSFHPVKHIATGEGGMITTNNPDLYEKLILFRTHGITKSPDLLIENHGGWYYEMQELGYNYRITDFQAALGVSQLSRADEGLAKRNQIAEKYDKALVGLPIKTPKIAEHIYHAFHLYVIQVPDRLALYNYLRENGIFAQVHYIPVHLMPFYKKQGWKKGDFPVMENYYEHCLSLPMFPSLKEEDQDYVIEKIHSFYIQ